MLRNHYTKRCLIVHGANNTNGAASMQYDCLPQFGDQLWDLVPANGGVQIKNRATGRCLVAFASNNTNGAPAAQYDCLPQYTDQVWEDRKSTRLNSSHRTISYAVFCLKKKNEPNQHELPHHAFQAHLDSN